MMWATTNRIGCGRREYLDGSSDRQYYVCNYKQGGNMLRRSVYKIGSPCSACDGNPCSGSLCGKLKKELNYLSWNTRCCCNSLIRSLVLRPYNLLSLFLKSRHRVCNTSKFFFLSVLQNISYRRVACIHKCLRQWFPMGFSIAHLFSRVLSNKTVSQERAASYYHSLKKCCHPVGMKMTQLRVKIVLFASKLCKK